MGPLATTAVAIAAGFLGSMEQLASNWLILLPLAGALAMGVSAWWLNRSSRITNLVFLPPPDDGDDALAIVRQPKRHDGVTEAIDQMEREWREQQGRNRG